MGRATKEHDRNVIPGWKPWYLRLFYPYIRCVDCGEGITVIDPHWDPNDQRERGQGFDGHAYRFNTGFRCANRRGCERRKRKQRRRSEAK